MWLRRSYLYVRKEMWSAVAVPCSTGEGTKTSNKQALLVRRLLVKQCLPAAA